MEHSVLGLRPGSVVQNSYRIESLLGEGGMGATFRATNLATNHPVAIKVMTPAFASNKKAVDLFRRESSLLRSVRSDAVVGYETTLMDAEGRLFLIMEYVSGKRLADYVKKGQRLNARDVLMLGRRLAGGLEAIHALGIVHRDVAPDNILLPEGSILGAKFIDFGLASDTAGTEQSILGDSFAGKLSYSAPEQLGLFGNRAQPATDVYGLGLVLMKVAGLKVPGEGMGFAALDARRDDIRITEPKVSPVLIRTLEAMLRADPANRPTDLAALFDRAIEEEAARPAETAARAGAKSDGPSQRSGRRTEKTLPYAEMPQLDAPPEERGPRRTPLIVAGVVGLLAIAGAAGWFARQGRPAPIRADVQDARKVLAQNDPLQKIAGMIDAGGAEKLNAALGALIAYQRDAANPAPQRERAAIMIAHMYDPSTFDPVRSPFTQPNAKAARRYYQLAADLGSADAAAALKKLAP